MNKQWHIRQNLKTVAKVIQRLLLPYMPASLSLNLVNVYLKQMPERENALESLLLEMLILFYTNWDSLKILISVRVAFPHSSFAHRYLRVIACKLAMNNWASFSN